MKANFFIKRQSSIQGLVHFSTHRKDHLNEVKEYVCMSSVMSCFWIHTDEMSEEELQLCFAKIQFTFKQRNCEEL